MNKLERNTEEPKLSHEIASTLIIYGINPSSINQKNNEKVRKKRKAKRSLIRSKKSSDKSAEVSLLAFYPSNSEIDPLRFLNIIFLYINYAFMFSYL